MNNREVFLPITKLRDYLKEAGIRISTLAELSGINSIHLQKCFAGEIDDRNGVMRTLSDENLNKLQNALHQLSLKLKYIFILYNTDMEVTKRNGRRYCPDCVAQIKSQLSPYISVLPFIQYALGWNRSKVRNTIDFKNSITYGNISQEDVDRINVTLAEISTRLDFFTLIKK